MTECMMTVEGRSRDTTEAIIASDFRLGARTNVGWIRSYTPEFVDFPFTARNPSWTEHERVVRAVNPRVAIAPDIEKGREMDRVIEYADDLARHADTVVIVPKEVHPETVPDRFRVGVPLADFGSGAPWSVWDYAGVGDVHLLGGGPARQLKMQDYLNVASLDTATLGKRARFGVWARDDGYVDAPPDLDTYRRRLEFSLNEYYRAWNPA